MSRYQKAASVKCSLKQGSMDLSCCLIRTGWGGGVGGGRKKKKNQHGVTERAAGGGNNKCR